MRPRLPGWNNRPGFLWTVSCPGWKRVLPELIRSPGRHLRPGCATHFPRLFRLLLHLYGNRYDFFYHLERILEAGARMWLARPADLKALDTRREADPGWFQSEQMLGGVCYVDLFAGNLAGIRAKIPYFKELGLTYLHLMPLFACPEGENDGGYAVSDYREVNPALGTMAELAEPGRESCARTASAWWWTSSSTTPPTSTHGLRPPWPAIRSTRTSTTCSPTGRCRTPTSAPCARFSRTCGRAASPIARTSTAGCGPPSTASSGTSTTATRPSSGPCWKRCCSWPTPASRCCAWMPWRSSGSRWAPPARTCPRRTC